MATNIAENKRVDPETARKMIKDAGFDGEDVEIIARWFEVLLAILPAERIRRILRDVAERRGAK